MISKIKTQEDLSAISPAHLEALKLGKEYFKMTTLNVVDKYKNMSIEDINLDLRKNANPFAVCFENWLGDFNLATGIRNANAFNAQEVFYIGNKKWDRRGAVGVHNYTPVNWLSSIDDFLSLKNKYTIVGIDNVPGSVSISSYQFNPNILFVFGEEGVGLTPAMQSMCKDIVEIPMYGSVRSLNCGVASGIVMHEFVSRYKVVCNE